MHPPLAVHRHRQCEEIIEQLNACHRERTVAKFFGGCNDLKEALDKCFHEEVRRRVCSVLAAAAF